MKYVIIVLVFIIGFLLGSGSYRTYNTTTTIYKMKDTTIIKPVPYKVFEKGKRDTVRFYRDTIINVKDTIIIDNSVSSNQLDSIRIKWIKSPVLTPKNKRFIIGPSVGVDYRGRPTIGVTLTYRILSF